MTLTLAQKQALWDRLNADPEVHANLRAAGQHMQPRPTAQGEQARTWGDGATSKRRHVIYDVSFADGYVECSCGTDVTDEGFVSLVAAWDVHRGVVPNALILAERASELASDDDVSTFLAAIEAGGLVDA